MAEPVAYRAIDLTHPTGAKRRKDLEWAEPGARGDVHRDQTEPGFYELRPIIQVSPEQWLLAAGLDTGLDRSVRG
jgi:hypothetical protein